MKRMASSMRLASSSSRTACRRAALPLGSKRSYATPVGQSSAGEFSVSSSAGSSGIKVATLDEGLPTSAVTVAVRAGSRFEPLPGLAHVLKNFVFKVRQRRSG